MITGVLTSRAENIWESNLEVSLIEFSTKCFFVMLGVFCFAGAFGQWESENAYRQGYHDGHAGDSEYCGIYEYLAPDNSKYTLGVVQSGSEFLFYNLTRRSATWKAGRVKATLAKSDSTVFDLDWIMGDGKTTRRCRAAWVRGQFEITGLSGGQTWLTKTWPPESFYSTPSDEEAISVMEEMSKSELRLARNSIYARHGRIFSSPDLREHFLATDWYVEDSTFVDSMLTQEERDSVLVIQMWERATSVLWKKKVDLDGDESLERCTALALDSQYCVIINNQVNVFADLWAEEKELARESPYYSSPWEDVDLENSWPSFSVRKLDESNPSKQIWISQLYDDWEDPGMLNHFLFYHNHQVINTTIGSGCYNCGRVTRDSLGYWALRVADCPEVVTHRYSVGNTGLIFEEEIKGPGICAACVDGEALVEMADGTKKRLKDIQSGDYVCAFEPATGEFETAEVESMIHVRHDVAVQYHFGQTSIIATEDHPFLSSTGSWVSLNPTKTERSYEGYVGVDQLKVGDGVMDAHGNEMTLLSAKELSFTDSVYSIEELSRGEGFVANGVVVGGAKPIHGVALHKNDFD